MAKEYYFTGVDFAVFIGLLAVSSGIGVYFAYKNRKNHSNKDFLTSNRSLSFFPVAMSLLASFQSSVTILGYPAEMFYRGTQFWMVILSSAMASILAAELFLPVFYRLGFTSVNQYLEQRFDSARVRLAVSFSFLLCTVPYMGVVLYGPSLALETVTGLSVTSSIWIIGGICTLYTSIGGIKAVVWTDVVQVFLMFAGLLVVMIRGFYLAGGVSEAFSVAARDDRIKFFNFKIDPYSTTTLWNAVIGMGVMWSGNYATSQTEVQRYCNVTTQRRAKLSLYVNFIGVSLLISCACLCGVALYGYYADCDPLRSGAITKTDQLMPYFVMQELRHLPGLAGLFVSCVFSASLSTMSSGFNALATVTYDDFLSKTSLIRLLPEKRVQLACKLIAFSYGMLAIAMAFVVSHIDSILEAAISITGALVGPMFGLFLLGILVPFANSFGVMCGLFTGEFFGLWVLIGSLQNPRPPEMLDTSVDQCPVTFGSMFMSNVTTSVSAALSSSSSSPQDQREGLQYLYQIAFLLVPVFGCLISLVVGLICSVISGGHKKVHQVQPKFLSDHAWIIWPRSLLPSKYPYDANSLDDIKPTDDISDDYGNDVEQQKSNKIQTKKHAEKRKNSKTNNCASGSGGGGGGCGGGVGGEYYKKLNNDKNNNNNNNNNNDNDNNSIDNNEKNELVNDKRIFLQNQSENVPLSSSIDMLNIGKLPSPTSSVSSLTPSSSSSSSSSPSDSTTTSTTPSTEPITTGSTGVGGGHTPKSLHSAIVPQQYPNYQTMVNTTNVNSTQL